MRVIAGALKGRTLRVPANATFRPTTDRVKESVFNILNGFVHWPTCAVCDLYAGSGSLGIEALSRGAASAVFVESHHASLAVIARNLGDLSLATRARVERRAVEQFLREQFLREQSLREQSLHEQAGRYGLVLADPPYRFDDIESLRDGIAGILEPDGIAVLEHERARNLDATPALRVVDRREYGTTAVTFFQPTHGASS